MGKRRPAHVATMLALGWLAGCSGKRPPSLGVSDGRLVSCPSSPNCVSSDAADKDHRVAPFTLDSLGPGVWDEVVATVAGLPRVSIVTQTADYVHAEARSRVFRFVDDLELHLRLDEGVIAVRSASRLGRSDFGVNRRRVESLRSALRTRGLVR